jgi:hypothetical protein
MSSSSKRKEAIRMKKLLSLLGGLVLALAFGTAYADDMKPVSNDKSDNTMQWNYDNGDKMILDEDLWKYDEDHNKGTVNQMPAKPGAGGSATGGSGESGSKANDKTYKPAQGPLVPLEKDFTEPYDNGRSGDDPYKPMEKYDGDTYRY